MVEAGAHASRGAYAEQLAAAERAETASRSRGARQLIAESRLEAASALINLGRYEEASAACEEALEFFVGKDNRTAVARERLARIAYHQGDIPTAQREIGQALRISREIGNRVGEANALNLLGAMLVVTGDLAGAEKTFEEVVGIATEIGDGETESLGLNNLALVKQRLGDVSGALDRLQQVLAVERKRGNQSGEASALENIGGSYATEGDLARAREYYEQAMGVYRSLSSASDLARSLYWLGEVLLWQGEVEAARARHREALQLRTEAGERGETALSTLALADVELQAAHLGVGGFDRAATALAEVTDEFVELDWAAEEATALSSLADAELAMDNPDAAETVVARARRRLDAVEEITAPLAVGISAAKIRAARGDARGALDDLAELAATARQASMRGQGYLIDLAVAEIEILAGNVETGRRRLETLRSDADARGWYLVSARAARVLEHNPVAVPSSS
jgi:tetratricopeptide (TPR) repeat protein